MTEIFSEFQAFVRRDVPLAMHTWLQLGGPAEYFAEPRNQDELLGLLIRCREEEVPIHVLGVGSNILVSDEGVPGLVIRLTAPEYCGIRNESNIVFAGGGAKLGRVITHSVHAGLAGMEGLIGIPGTVGGALRGNAGTQGSDIGQWLEQVTVTNFSGEVMLWKRDEISFNYRESSLDDVVILEAKFVLEEDDPIELAKRLQKLWIIRKTSQPMGHQCSGCIFRNPIGMSAAELVERSGLKGTRVGGAVISDRNPNFVIAEAECTSSDVLRLIDMVREQIARDTEIELELELDIW